MKLKDITIRSNDLQVLMEVAQGYTSENGLDSVSRYAVPEDVDRAIVNAKAAIRDAGELTRSEA